MLFTTAWFTANDCFYLHSPNDFYLRNALAKLTTSFQMPFDGYILFQGSVGGDDEVLLSAVHTEVYCAILRARCSPPSLPYTLMVNTIKFTNCPTSEFNALTFIILDWHHFCCYVFYAWKYLWKNSHIFSLFSSESYECRDDHIANIKYFRYPFKNIKRFNQ